MMIVLIFKKSYFKKNVSIKPFYKLIYVLNGRFCSYIKPFTFNLNRLISMPNLRLIEGTILSFYSVMEHNMYSAKLSKIIKVGGKIVALD